MHPLLKAYLSNYLWREDIAYYAILHTYAILGTYDILHTMKLNSSMKTYKTF